jgi:RimJ/RimL family protein N-acetyltransferase
MPFDPQPTLVGRIVALRSIRIEDFDRLYAVAGDPLIWEQHPVKDRHKKEIFAAFFEDARKCGGTLIASEPDGPVIGSSRFHAYDENSSEVEIGWTFLARSHWGGMYNGEMKRLMLTHAFRYVENVVLLVGPHNIRSQRAVEKIGGVRTGWRTDGGGRDPLLYRITASGFAARESGCPPAGLD